MSRAQATNPAHEFYLPLKKEGLVAGGSRHGSEAEVFGADVRMTLRRTKPGHSDFRLRICTFYFCVFCMHRLI